MQELTPNELVTLISTYLLTHLSEDYSPDILKKLFDVSDNFLNRRFKKISGIPPAKLLNQYRMEKAVELLLSADKNISAIKNVAPAVGYRTEQGFLDAFKRHFNVYPSEYVAREIRKRRHKND
jgi:AraC-like DNA-binding protein